VLKNHDVELKKHQQTNPSFSSSWYVLPLPQQQLSLPQLALPVNESNVVFFVLLSQHLSLLLPPVMIAVVAFKSIINIK